MKPLLQCQYSSIHIFLIYKEVLKNQILQLRDTDPNLCSLSTLVKHAYYDYLL